MGQISRMGNIIAENLEQEKGLEMKRGLTIGMVVGVALFVLTACGGVYKVGQIGTHEVWQVTTRDVVAPSTQTVLTHNLKDGAVTKIEGGTGSSFLGQVAGPAATALGAYYIGQGIGESGDEVTVNETNNMDNKSGSAAGAISDVDNAAVAGAAAASSSSAKNFNANVNENTNKQGQGQLQGQGQGQAQGQAQGQLQGQAQGQGQAQKNQNKNKNQNQNKNKGNAPGNSGNVPNGKK